ncbi:MAG: FAD-binding oxidoreductase [Novosphingobium sp.]|nr:FAD-binding oxidoreductase [Novosphingobium sp.]
MDGAPAGKREELSGWGRFPRVETTPCAPRSDDQFRAALSAASGAIARGNGRAYGDSAVSPGATLSTRHFNRMLSFDDSTGMLVAESGVLLADVIAAFLPRGWFPFVTPGTKFVSMGGAIAADVHGKNHHKEGSFGAFVEWIEVMGADGAVTRCSHTENADLFGWTVGGMGLTGVILRAAIRLRRVKSGWIRQTMVPAANLDAAIAALEQSLDATYSVAWIDCLATGAALGRSLVMLGEHAALDDLDPARRGAPFATPRHKARRVPIDFPSFALNGFSVAVFNDLYYARGKARAGASLVDWDSYFYPLDAVLEWNRIYGKRGFAQFQCVLPTATAREGLAELLRAISGAGAGSFLAVLKRMGAQDSRCSFPMEGYTLALDFPASPANLALLERLDAITLAHGGRFYLAKDARMRRDTLHASDPRWASFAAMRERDGLSPVFRSAQSERLGL